MTFEKFEFKPSQTEKYFLSAKRDLKIAIGSDIIDVQFKFSYDALLKLAITVCAHEGLRVKSKAGHHIELVDKLAVILHEPDVSIIGNEMRKKRNFDLYSGGLVVSEKEAREYCNWVKDVFSKAEDFLNQKKGVVKLL
ncbi:hypothetical protein L6270_01660 [Candidatus Parcubacteria bacterium]|nr:hypothetical protein [Patescibacteria group bacterium]MBU4309846.1 hypothetical protein [Patescibacteria group bacterium]MBU4431743.1 hypothetical protein [Patescibacteria group bacterium]MBU4578185.1 hypothetical protein [Patescibacteria group bacterium]MCG2696721.1 hypothetical protein [Candidatus Parcubacteria bacterium]